MKIYLAGGCFWGLEAFMANVPGVISTKVGYINGKTNNPTYEDVCNGSGHAEAVEICYLPSIVSYEELLEYFFYVIDPTSLNKQGNDVGVQYRTGIYYKTDEEKNRGEAWLKAKQQEYSKPIMVELLPLREFVAAEEYHQAYLAKNPMGYCHINLTKALEQVGKARINTLSPITKDVMLNAGTEPPFTSKYNDFFEAGIYFDAISGRPLFSSADKFPCTCGWPSFAKAFEGAVIYREDFSHGMHRIEVRSKTSGAHLGHCFDDGPRELGGKRFCINGVALLFVSDRELAEA